MSKINGEAIDSKISLKLLSACFLFALGYFVLAWIGHLFSIKPHEFVPFWLPGGLYLAVLFFTKVKHWPYFILAAFIGNITFDLIDGKPLWLTLIFSTANSMDAMIGVGLFRWARAAIPTFKKPAEVIIFFMLNVIIAPCVSSIIGASTLSLYVGASFWPTCLTWWSGNAVGVIIVAPIMLVAIDRIVSKRLDLSMWRKVEFIGMSASVLVLTWFIFSGKGDWVLTQKYLVLYVLIWAIFRFGLIGVVWTNLLVAVVVVICQMHYQTSIIWHFELATYQENIALQVYLFTICFTSIFVSSIIADRNQLINDLSLSEQKFKSLIENASDAIFIHDLNGNLIEVNEEACKRLECSREELLNKRIIDIISPKFSEGVKDRIQTILKQGQMFIEIEHVSKSGRVIPTEVNATLIDYGYSKAVLGIARNLTERKNAENKLKENEERYRLVIKASNDGIWDWDLKTNNVYYSPKWKEMIGYEDNELENTIDTWLKTIHPEDLIHAQQLLKEHFEKDKPFFHISRFMHKDGSFRWMQVNGFALRDNEGQPYRMIGNHTDITDKKVAEDKLRETELRFRVAFLTSPDAININRLTDGLYIDVNEGFARLTGWSKEETIGRTSVELSIWVNVQDRDKLVKALKKDGYCDNLETQFRVKDGSLRTCLMSAQLINLQGENCILSITRDITNLKITESQILEKNVTIEAQNKELTESFNKIQLINEELRKAKEKAEESDRLKSAFLANMSHELRTPLNTIMGFSDLLETRELSPEKSRGFAQIINKRGNDLLVLVNDLLDISKIEAGQMIISETSGNLKEFLLEVHQSFGFKNEGKSSKSIDFRCSIDLPEKDCLISADFNHLKQILVNLIGNAFKFTYTGFIEFGCSITEKKELLFYVKDSGIGIPEDKVGIIFERFRQANETYLSHELGGTGLGLSIAKALIELQGGKIWVESVVNEGACFYFTLPYKSSNTQTERVTVTSNLFYNWNGRAVLIVEDDKYNADYLIEIISETKVKYYQAFSGKQAIESVKTHPDIELILMDIRLPDMSGFEVTQQIKLLKPEIYVIAQTAYASDFDKYKALKAGCSDYLPKPLDPSKLLNLINKYFKTVVKS